MLPCNAFRNHSQIVVAVMTAKETAYTQASTSACNLRLAEDAPDDVSVGEAKALLAEVTGEVSVVIVLLLALVVEVGTADVVVVELVNEDRSVLVDVTSTLVVLVEYCSQSVAVLKRL